MKKIENLSLATVAFGLVVSSFVILLTACGDNEFTVSGGAGASTCVPQDDMKTSADLPDTAPYEVIRTEGGPKELDGEGQLQRLDSNNCDDIDGMLVQTDDSGKVQVTVKGQTQKDGAFRVVLREATPSGGPGAFIAEGETRCIVEEPGSVSENLSSKTFYAVEVVFADVKNYSFSSGSGDSGGACGFGVHDYRLEFQF